MSEKLKTCPFCGSLGEDSGIGSEGGGSCSNREGCIMYHITLPFSEWNSRPIEDALQARITEIEAERQGEDGADKICENCLEWNEDDQFCVELKLHGEPHQTCSNFIPVSPCCGEVVDEDIMICPTCKEHC